MKNFLLMGRVDGQDDIAKIVSAKTLKDAKTTFTNYLKQKQSWSMGEPVHIEQALELSEAIENAVISESFADITRKYEQALNTDHKNKLNLILVAAYEATIHFNPYDIASLLCSLSEDTSEEPYTVDMDNDDTTILFEFDVAVYTEDKLSTFYHLYHALSVNMEKTMLYYMNNYELHLAIGDDTKNSELAFTELKAFPKIS